jgi:hypothetical protein
LRELVLELCELLLSGLECLLQGAELGLSLISGLIDLSKFPLSVRKPGLHVGEGTCCALLLLELRSHDTFGLLQAIRFCARCLEPVRV